MRICSRTNTRVLASLCLSTERKRTAGFYNFSHGLRYCSTNEGNSSSVPPDSNSNHNSSYHHNFSNTGFPFAAADAQKTPKYQGVVILTSKNINTEMETKVPLFLYFHVPNHPDVATYTKRLVLQVDQTNRRLQGERFGEIYQEFGKDAGLAIKLGMVDCLKEIQLSDKFGIDPHMFPLIYFVRNRMFVDKLAGIVPESQVAEAISAFIDYAKTESKNEANGEGMYQKIKRHDNDDENSMTLLQAAHGKLKDKQLPKAKELFQKSYDTAIAEVDETKKRIGADRRKMTSDMMERLKREGSYNVAPQALCGLAMCAMASKQEEEARKLVQRVREEFPSATADLKEVAEAVARIDMLLVSGFDTSKDSYVSLLRYDTLDDPAQFYTYHLKLAVAHYVELRPHLTIEECLRLIRAERKLLPALKEAGIIPQDLVLSPNAQTPARIIINRVFEALGSTHEKTIAGRKVLQNIV